MGGRTCAEESAASPEGVRHGDYHTASLCRQWRHFAKDGWPPVQERLLQLLREQHMGILALEGRHEGLGITKCFLVQTFRGTSQWVGGPLSKRG